VALEFDRIERFEYGGQRSSGQRRAKARCVGFADPVAGTADDAVQGAQPFGERGRPDVLQGRRLGASLQVPGNGVGRSDQQDPPGPLAVLAVVVVVDDGGRRGQGRRTVVQFAALQFDGRQVAGRVLAGRVERVAARRRRAGPRRRFRLNRSEAAGAAVMTR